MCFFFFSVKIGGNYVGVGLDCLWCVVGDDVFVIEDDDMI